MCQINAGDGFGDRVFYLNTRVGLHKHKVARVFIQQKLYSAQTAVADGLGKGSGRKQQLLADTGVERWGGGDFQQFLIAPLQGAVALPEMANLFAVADDLYFDMPGTGNQALDIERLIAKRAFGFRAAAGKGFVQFIQMTHRAHATSAATRQRLEHHCSTLTE